MENTVVDQIFITKRRVNNEVSIVVNGPEINQITDEILEVLVDKLKNTIIDNNTNIIMDCQGESLPPNPLLICSKIMVRLTEKYPNSYKDFIVISAGADTQKNYELYNYACEKYKLFKGEIKFNCHYEDTVGRPATTNRKFYDDNFLTTPRVKSKKFLAFNNTTRAHRFYLLSKILENNLVDKAYYSFLLRGEKELRVNIINANYTSQLIYQIPNLAAQVKQTVLDNVDLLPMELNWSSHDDYRKFYDKIINEVRYYNDSYFSVITETKFFRDVDQFTEGQYDSYLFSEKTWKPILAKHPFILVTRYGALEVLREMGYKTFSPLIDETYDTIVDDELRLEAIFNEIVRLCNFTDEQWIDWQTQIQDIVEFNFTHAIERYKSKMEI